MPQSPSRPPAQSSHAPQATDKATLVGTAVAPFMPASSMSVPGPGAFFTQAAGAGASPDLSDLYRTAGSLARINRSVTDSLAAIHHKGLQDVLGATSVVELVAAQTGWAMSFTNALIDYWQRVGGMAWTTEAMLMPETLGPIDKAVKEQSGVSDGAQGAEAQPTSRATDPFNLWMAPFNAAWGALTSAQPLH